MRNLRKKTDDIFIVEDQLAGLQGSDLKSLKQLAIESPRKRARICMHQNTTETVQEMVIALAQGVYIRPHRHTRKIESYLVLEGKAELVIFEDSGEIASVLSMGDAVSGLPFFNRIGLKKFHAFFLFSDSFVFKETTNGPFDPSETQYAPWSPEQERSREVADFTAALKNKIDARRNG